MRSQERRVSRMRKRAEAANAYPVCALSDGAWCAHDTRGHWHAGPMWALTTGAEIRAAEGLKAADG